MLPNSGTHSLVAAEMSLYFVLVKSISFSAKNHIPAWHCNTTLTDAKTLDCQEIYLSMFPYGRVKETLNHNNGFSDKIAMERNTIFNVLVI